MVYGTIKVRGRDKSETRPTILTFVDRDVYDATRRAIMKSAGLVVVDEFWGYKIFTSVEDAIETASLFGR